MTIIVLAIQIGAIGVRDLVRYGPGVA